MSDLRQGYLSVGVSIDRVSGKPQLPGRQTATTRRSRHSHPAISLRKMGVERHGHVIDKERVDLLRLLDRWPQTWAEIGYDGIVDCDARLYGQIVNSVRSKVIGQPIKSVPAKIQVTTIEGATGIGCGIEGKVEEAHHALGKWHHGNRVSSELELVSYGVFPL